MHVRDQDVVMMSERERDQGRERMRWRQVSGRESDAKERRIRSFTRLQRDAESKEGRDCIIIMITRERERAGKQTNGKRSNRSTGHTAGHVKTRRTRGDKNRHTDMIFLSFPFTSCPIVAYSNKLHVTLSLHAFPST